MSDQHHLELKHVVFVGRSWEDYCQMFNLNEADLQGRNVLDCPGGAASFARTAASKGVEVTATDIAYYFSPDELLAKGLEDLQTVQHITSQREDCIEMRETNPRFASFLEEMTATLHETVADIREQGYGTRYVPGRLPNLPFADGQFDIALSGNLLFIYSQQLGRDFHVEAVRELMRVTREEIRLYPLVSTDGQESPFLQDVLQLAAQEGWAAEKLPATYELMPGYELLRLIRN
ncbi:methyltransferase domain-containing protein [Tumebacillus flagellatus]|uniref:SAM-dependent methyltransferase n=1 Tax=Tumebacillus flagellatus TaxID=1157490 RepID=A0A074LVA1_9BACL|nr:methyltransferase domain-containing protein [Tumebacillus flagellatus]KEO83908.1 hypothetical protein EL26_06890 [Tumebacillus flagellatus]